MNIIYLSPDQSKYRAAFYQHDVMQELERQHKVYFYGPGFTDYDVEDDISNVIAKSPFYQPDLICFGHGWLSDSPGKEVNRFSHIDCRENTLPKVLILNKEYANLDQKLEYIKNQKVDVVFTHHHAVEEYHQRTGTKFVFWPFGVNHNKFYDYGLPKEFDLTFTGILRNPTFTESQTDLRIKVQSLLFHTIGEVRLKKRNKYKKYAFYWNAQATYKLTQRVNQILHRQERLTEYEYYQHLNKSRICLNTLSPLDLISTRYFECMASKCLVFAQKSELYNGLFEEGKHYISFEENLSDFEEKLFFYLEESNIRSKIVDAAYRHVLAHHTWEKRICDFTNAIS